MTSAYNQCSVMNGGRRMNRPSLTENECMKAATHILQLKNKDKMAEINGNVFKNQGNTIVTWLPFEERIIPSWRKYEWKGK